METKIPILDLAPGIKTQWDELKGAIESVLLNTQFIQGPEVKLFEKEVAEYLGVKHAIGLNSGTDALVIALRALNIKPGDEVITTPLTFFATAEAISHVGATPVFVDIDPISFNLDPAQVALKINAKTKAIIPVHIYGQTADLGALLQLAEKTNVPLVEDCAQCFGGDFQGKKLGTLGRMGTYSFFPSKNLGAFGDGGLLVTNDDALAGRARALKSHGSKQKYLNEEVGYNSRLDEIQASVLRVRLRYVDRSNAGRRAAAMRYDEMLQSVPGVETPSHGKHGQHVYHQYTVRIKNGKRDALHRFFADRGITTMIYYPICMHKLPVYPALNQLSLPLAEEAVAEVLSLPIWPEIPAETQFEVVRVLREGLSQL